MKDKVEELGNASVKLQEEITEKEKKIASLSKEVA